MSARRFAAPVLCSIALAGCSGTSHEKPAFVAAKTPGPFTPQDFTAVSEKDFWLLGTVPCHGTRCWTILSTHDGGAGFTRRPAPPLPTEGTVPTLRFATLRDGFAFVADAAGPLFVTHDGGATWHRLSIDRVEAFASGGGFAYVVTRRRFLRSPISVTAWRSIGRPLGSPVDLSAHGSNLWLLAGRAGHRDRLVRSRNAGRTFTSGKGPCSPDLGGSLAPVSADTVWAVCPTGLLAFAARATNGGARFTRLRTPLMPNSAGLAPASASTAVLTRNDPRPGFLRTTDGGSTWLQARTPKGATAIFFVGFTDARAGAAIVQTAKGWRQELWRTTDGGAAWRRVSLP